MRPVADSLTPSWIISMPDPRRWELSPLRVCAKLGLGRERGGRGGCAYVQCTLSMNYRQKSVIIDVISRRLNLSMRVCITLPLVPEKEKKKEIKISWDFGYLSPLRYIRYIFRTMRVVDTQYENTWDDSMLELIKWNSNFFSLETWVFFWAILHIITKCFTISQPFLVMKSFQVLLFLSENLSSEISLKQYNSILQRMNCKFIQNFSSTCFPNVVLD